MIKIELNEIVVKQGILYGYPCVLIRHGSGFGWIYRGESKDLGNITRENAIKRFDSNFALDI